MRDKFYMHTRAFQRCYLQQTFQNSLWCGGPPPQHPSTLLRAKCV
uniref:Uncharacterized protein n=1 Tax=Anguilla anguilla TaxID=7936 RepID=A0A0E9WBS4_ANGAN